MTLNLTWTQRLKGSPTSFRNCLKDFFDNVLPALTFWSPHGSPVKLGTTPGQQGGTGVRDSDGMEFAIFNFLSGDPTGTGSAGNPGGDVNHSYFSRSSQSTQASGMMGVGVNKGSTAYFDAASKFMGANGITAITFNMATLSGFFRRGETLNVAGGTYQATILEVFHDSTEGGVIFVSNWTTGTPGANNITGASLAGATSGATATAWTTSNDRPSSYCWYRMKAQDTYYLTSLTGANPTGTITGGTTGFTSTFSTWTPASGGKLVVTAGQGRYLHGETLSWAGGSAIVEHVPFGAEMFSIGDNVGFVNESDTSGYLVGEDADRLILLFPNESSGPTTYAILAFGKWGVDMRGFGEGDMCILAEGSAFPNEQSTHTWGIFVDPRDGQPCTISSDSNSIPSDIDAGGSIPPGTLMQPSRATAAQIPVAYDYAQNADANANFYLNVRKQRELDRFTFQRLAPTGGRNRPAFVLHGFYTGAVPSGVKQLFTNPDGSRYGLQIDNGTSGLFIDFTDGSIVP